MRNRRPSGHFIMFDCHKSNGFVLIFVLEGADGERKMCTVSAAVPSQ